MSSSIQNKLNFAGVALVIMMGLSSVFTLLPLINTQAEELVNQTASEMQAAPPLCDNVQLGNAAATGGNLSSAEVVVDIRCHLAEARNAVAADAAEAALEQIDEADRTLVATFGNNSAMVQNNSSQS